MNYWMISRYIRLCLCWMEPECSILKIYRLIVESSCSANSRMCFRDCIILDLIYQGMRHMHWNWERCSKQSSSAGFRRKKRSIWERHRNILIWTLLNCWYRKIERRHHLDFIKEQTRLLCSNSTLSLDSGRYPQFGSARVESHQWGLTIQEVRYKNEN